MKSLLLASLLVALVLPSCILPKGLTDRIPVLITLKWEIEPGLFAVLQPTSKGGYSLELEGEGRLSDNLRIVEGGLEYSSPRTGLTYFVSRIPGQRKPSVQIIGAGGAPVEARPVDPKPVAQLPAGAKPITPDK